MSALDMLYCMTTQMVISQLLTDSIERVRCWQIETAVQEAQDGGVGRRSQPPSHAIVYLLSQSDVRRADIHWERVCVEAHETTCCPNVPYSIINKLLILKIIRMVTFELSNEFTPLLGVHNGVHKGVQIGVQIGGPDWGSRFCGYPY